METNGNIENKRSFTNKQVLSIIVFVILATFYVTMVYFNHIAMGNQIKTLEATHHLEMKILKDRIEYVNDRLTRKISGGDSGTKEEIKDE